MVTANYSLQQESLNSKVNPQKKHITKIFFIGTFRANLIHGRGLFYSPAGSLIYQGDFRDGVKYGQGVEYYHTGSKLYEGRWVEDEWHGFGVWYDILGDVIYKGDFKYGKPMRKGDQGRYGSDGKRGSEFVGRRGTPGKGEGGEEKENGLGRNWV
jgi:antitoxin component YwqK of YwqJK toxin-antitoxin module